MLICTCEVDGVLAADVTSWAADSAATPAADMALF